MPLKIKKKKKKNGERATNLYILILKWHMCELINAIFVLLGKKLKHKKSLFGVLLKAMHFQLNWSDINGVTLYRAHAFLCSKKKNNFFLLGNSCLFYSMKTLKKQQTRWTYCFSCIQIHYFPFYKSMQYV